MIDARHVAQLGIYAPVAPLAIALLGLLEPTPAPVDPATPADRFDYLATLRVPGAFHAQQLRPSAEHLARLRSARRRR